MLRHLTIEHFGLIQALDLALPAGFVAVTGETGAGKSMLLGAVAALLGARVHRELLHEGRTTRLSGVFQAPPDAARREWCQPRGLPEDGPLEITREISQGRSRSWVNGQPVQQRDLRELARLLADFHGQRDLAQLLERERHADLLDALPAIAPARAAHDALWQTWKEAAGQLAAARKSRDRQRELRELWQFQSEELEKLAARPGEDRELEAEHRVLSNSEELQRTGFQAADALEESEDSVHSRLVPLQRELAQAAKLDPAFASAAGLLAEALIQVQEAAQQARARAEALEGDPERLEQIRERLQQLDRMIRKHGGSLDLLLARQSELDDLLARGDDLDGQILRLEGEEERLRAALSAARAGLSAARSSGGAALSRRIQPLLEELGILGGRLDVCLEEPAAEWDAVGAESPAFYISTNPDTPLGPLEEIASGGELSRVMLALKCLLLEECAGQCLVFDEIDAGISGKAALAVATLMRQLAARHQLLCITHLPQIAAAARHQIGVEKAYADGATRIDIRLLDEEGRLRQIARLQSGREEEPDLAAARRLLESLTPLPS
ncbi:MAG: DNA repair protein RecN [Candidatus Delongbacteria bacterium]